MFEADFIDNNGDTTPIVKIDSKAISLWNRLFALMGNIVAVITLIRIHNVNS